MKETVLSGTSIRLIEKVTHDLEDAQDHLTALDSAIGDGDHGVSITVGMRGVRKRLPALAGRPVAEILAETGQAFQSAAGATVGALLGAALMRAAPEFDGRDEITTADLHRAFAAALQAVQDLGRAKPGDKTLVDALAPAVSALETAARADEGIRQAMARAAEAAHRGALATADMQAMRGRASRLGARSIGCQDPGATSFYLILKSLAE